MSNIEKYAEKIHDTALKEGKKYAKSHGQSIIEELAYGRGFKAGAMTGYEQAEKDFALTTNDILRIQMLFDDHPNDTCVQILNRFNETRKK